MIVVIQCAARKRRNAGHLLTAKGKPVVFVADPQAAPSDGACAYARPDECSDDGRSWRQQLTEYNMEPGNNPLRLLPAYQLYERDIYSKLVDRFQLDNVYILSAGWGLIRAGFLTPAYDITFAKSAKIPEFKRREREDRYDDFRMLPDATGDDILFLGGKDYLPLFGSLTGTKSKRTVFIRQDPERSHLEPIPKSANFTFRPFGTRTRTNWHYECAEAILDGSIRI